MNDVFIAALRQNMEVLKEYLKYGDINITDKRGQSLLHYACRSNSIDIVIFLLENYINPNIADTNGETPLFIAISLQKIGMIKLFIRMGANPNHINNLGQSPLFKAISYGNEEILNLLLDNNTDLKRTDNNNQTIAYMAINAHNLDLLDFIIKKEPLLLNSIDLKGNNLLHHAIKVCDYPITSYLIEKGISIHLKNKDRESAIFIAARSANLAICQLIYRHRAILEGLNLYDEDIITVAKDNEEEVRIFIEEARYKQKYQHYMLTFPYHVAIISQNYDKILEMSSYDVKKNDDIGMSPLDYAKLLKDEYMIKVLKALID